MKIYVYFFFKSLLISFCWRFMLKSALSVFTIMLSIRSFCCSISSPKSKAKPEIREIIISETLYLILITIEPVNISMFIVNKNKTYCKSLIFQLLSSADWFKGPCHLPTKQQKFCASYWILFYQIFRYSCSAMTELQLK